MDNDTLHYFWNRIWWGLETKQTLLDYFRNYGGVLTPENKLDEIYHALMKRKSEIISASEVDKTQVQKLYVAFQQLNQKGIVAVHYAGSSLSDGKSQIQELIQYIIDEAKENKIDFNPNSLKGYCFYHEQDIEVFVPDIEGDIISESYFYLAYGLLDNEGETLTLLTKEIVHELKNAGLNAEWDGDTTSRIKLNDFYWINESCDQKNWNELATEQILGSGYKQENSIDEIPAIGQSIRFVKGKFQRTNGTVRSVDSVNKIILIEVNLFGRVTPVEMSFVEFAESI